jgi:ABC-type multidrug transport system ATPase subunit
VLKVIQSLAREGMTMLIVTHEMDFALSISDRVVMMENGVVQSDMPPQRIRSDADPSSPAFVNLWECNKWQLNGNYASSWPPPTVWRRCSAGKIRCIPTSPCACPATASRGFD